jgi:hypothetical protein
LFHASTTIVLSPGPSGTTSANAPDALGSTMFPWIVSDATPSGSVTVPSTFATGCVTNAPRAGEAIVILGPFFAIEPRGAVAALATGAVLEPFDAVVLGAIERPLAADDAPLEDPQPAAPAMTSAASAARRSRIFMLFFLTPVRASRAQRRAQRAAGAASGS